MTEQEAIDELMAMSEEELLLVDFTLVKWLCQGKGCCNGTKVRDYGIAPMYWKKTSSQFKGFFDIGRWFWMCGKHAKLFKRLKKSFSVEAVDAKLWDFNKIKIIPLPKPKQFYCCREKFKRCRKQCSDCMLIQNQKPE